MRFLFLFAAALSVAAVFSPGVRAEQVSVEKVKRSPQFPDARAKIAFPSDGGSVFSFSPEVALEVSGYELGVQTNTGRKNRLANSDKGQHLHLIVDNKPYMAIYDTSKPVRLSGLTPGPHTLVVFPSRSYHESVKTSGAADVVNFNVISSFAISPWLAGPALIYSRPKGTYKGAGADKVMVDFYLHNVGLSKDGYTVRLSVFPDGGAEPVVTEVFDKWQPAFVKGLKSGGYSFFLELVDPDGKTVPGKFGSRSRIVKIER
ncbi:MAG: hypothetical protein ACR2NQ_01990 [Thermodesulfobacteriota bacterium]